MAEMIRFLCSGCGKRLKVSQTASGRTMRCPNCGTAVVVPEAPDIVVQATAEPGPTPLQPPPDLYDDDMERADRPSRRNGAERPGKVQAIALMILIGGIFATSISILVMFLFLFSLSLICCLWPGLYYSLVMGIMAIVAGSQLLGQNAHRLRPPEHIAIMQIINIVNLDIPNCTMGILTLIFLSDPEVRAYFRK